jgi:hypothetical protein
VAPDSVLTAVWLAEGVLRFHRAKARVLQEQLTEALATVRMQVRFSFPSL